MKQRASLRFAQATAAPSWVIRSLMLVIRNTFSSFDLSLSSEPYFPRVSPIMLQANRSCNSVLTKGTAIRACIFGVVLIPYSKYRNTTAFHGRLTNCSIVSACISDDARVPCAFCLRVVPYIMVSRKPSMALLSFRAIKCPLAEFLHSTSPCIHRWVHLLIQSPTVSVGFIFHWDQLSYGTFFSVVHGRRLKVFHDTLPTSAEYFHFQCCSSQSAVTPFGFITC